MMKRIAILLCLLALVPAAALAESYSAILTGAAEVPVAGDTDGAGFAVVTIDGTTVRYSVWTQNIAAPTMAHIHIGAPGVPGPIVVDFNVATLTNGTTAISADLANQIRANPAGYYVNVHNADFPGGAIRGQLSTPASGTGTTVAYFPVVGKSRGANDTNFVTDLRIVNDSGVTANVTLDYFAASLEGQSGPTITRTVTVAPGEEKVLDDFVGTLLGTSGLGGLRVTSDRNVLVAARILNDLREVAKGTTGLAVASQSAGATSGMLPFLSQASDVDFSQGLGFRTNMGYFNPNASAVNVTFTARRAGDGAVLGTATRTIPPFSMVQTSAFDIVNTVAAQDRPQANFYVTWTSTAPVFVYASVIDNKTGDSVFIH